MNKSYITSERFIHDELLRRSERVVSKLPDFWRRDRRIDASILIWPAEPVQTDDKQPHEGIIHAPYPAEKRSDYLRAVVAKTKPYAVLAVEQLSNEIKAIFESHHGTRTWTIPINRHGDVRVLGDAITTDDTESLGILWRRGMQSN